MRKDYLSKSENNLLLMTYYFPTYNDGGKCKLNARKDPRKYRLLRVGIRYVNWFKVINSDALFLWT